MEKLIIVGGVAAGATAAAKARRLSSDAEITILEAGPDISFANCGLPYFIAGDIQNRSSLILQSPESFKEQYNVTVHLNSKVEKIDRQTKTVSVRNSQTGEWKDYSYTKLILAQGGRPIKPPMPGADLSHVFTLWTLEDMDQIDRYIKDHQPKSAVIAGGGFIGLEMAEALAKRGMKVHVVEKMPHVMALMDAEIAGFVQQEMDAYGLVLHANVGVKEIATKQVTLDNGESLVADMVLLSIGVRPTLQLAMDAGLKVGEAGGLLVDSYLQTEDPSIYAAGDMVEIEHKVHHGKVRIPLAGPANRQGRIVAENALGGRHSYQGSLGTSIVRVFDAVAGITGLSLKAAKQQGIDAEAITVHKEHHVTYYPGSKQVTLRIVYDRKTGVVLGGQTAGYAGADRRLDVIAMAAYNAMKVQDLADVDFAYSPPLGTAHDVVNMAAFVAENRLSGNSPAVLVEELDAFLEEESPIVIDVRDSFAFEKGHIISANHVPLEFLREVIGQIPENQTLLVYDETGKKGHQSSRLLQGLVKNKVVNISGGFQSIQRYARAIGFKNCQVKVPAIVAKKIGSHSDASDKKPEQESTKPIQSSGPLIVDVRTSGEFSGGAVPNAINIPLDELQARIDELGALDRDITLYCASGARSGYAARILMQMGFTQITNGGGIMQMMRKRR